MLHPSEWKGTLVLQKPPSSPCGFRWSLQDLDHWGINQRIPNMNMVSQCFPCSIVGFPIKTQVRLVGYSFTTYLKKVCVPFLNLSKYGLIVRVWRFPEIGGTAFHHQPSILVSRLPLQIPLLTTFHHPWWVPIWMAFSIPMDPWPLSFRRYGWGPLVIMSPQFLRSYDWIQVPFGDRFPTRKMGVPPGLIIHL